MPVYGADTSVMFWELLACAVEWRGGKDILSPKDGDLRFDPVPCFATENREATH